MDNIAMTQINQITIVGTGLLGASVGLAAKAAGVVKHVTGVSRNLQTAQKAAQIGAIDMAYNKIGDAIAGTDLIIVAVPLSGFAYTFDLIRPHLTADMIVTDVGSTKASVLRDARANLGNVSRFVGSHPMAGSEKQGPEAGDAELFKGKPCIVTREPENDGDAVGRVKDLWQALGMHVLEMSAEEHDLKTATVSHLPHAAAAMLVQTANQLGGWDVASTGFCDTTRLASSNPPMRVDIMHANKDALLQSLAAFKGNLELLMTKLEADDCDGVLASLNESMAARDRWLADKRCD
ncbi:prephenate dehydrogenase [Poriferisphaera sp. WC338]|uniref:prephenate dehydrogenase n=1 Tax=Poriferisphaera sp. WC338 TaxID=3425129 RepID=UPI003D815EFB